MNRREFRVSMVTEGDPPYSEPTWAATLELIIQSEIIGVSEVEVEETAP